MNDTNKKIDEKALRRLTAETIRIINKMLAGADKYKPVQMTEAELWESLVPPFED